MGSDIRREHRRRARPRCGYRRNRFDEHQLLNIARARGFARDFGPLYAGTGLAGFIFAATGPLAIILTVAAQGGFDDRRIASWIFGGFFVNGLLTIFASLRTRTPLVFFWTIPGTVLIGPALTHLSDAQILGACMLSGALMLALGLSGWVTRGMRMIPMPIVMGMVAGVFLRFGTDLVRAIDGDPAVAAPMAMTYFALSAWPRAGRRMPPVLGALLVGLLSVALSGHIELGNALAGASFARPMLIRPEYDLAAIAELVIPLSITVLAVQNMQGIAVLEAAGHRVPIGAVTSACGIWSILAAIVGCSPSCLAGPTNALVVGSGERHRHYTAAVFVGCLSLMLGALAPLFTRLMLAMPVAFVATLGGLALLRVLLAAFVSAFSAKFSFGALASLLVTLSGISIAGVGAPFWGLIGGLGVSVLLERADFHGLAAGKESAGRTRREESP